MDSCEKKYSIELLEPNLHKGAQKAVKSRQRVRIVAAICMLFGLLFVACLGAGVYYFLVYRTVEPVVLNSTGKPAIIGPDEVKRCGIAVHKPILNKIMNGVSSAPHSWPWAVVLERNEKESERPFFDCSGSLIRSKWVLTAAHCLVKPSQLIGHKLVRSDKDGKGEEIMYLEAQDLTISVGVHNRSSKNNPLKMLKVKRIIPHPDFNIKTFNNDIALLELENGISRSEKVQYLCLDSSVKINTNQTINAIGWGATLISNTTDILHQVSFQVQDDESCSKEIIYNKTTQFCAGVTSKFLRAIKDICDGDNGGAVMVEHLGHWTAVGVASSSNYRGNAAFTRVNYYNDWIVETISN